MRRQKAVAAVKPLKKRWPWFAVHGVISRVVVEKHFFGRLLVAVEKNVHKDFVKFEDRLGVDSIFKSRIGCETRQGLVLIFLVLVWTRSAAGGHLKGRIVTQLSMVGRVLPARGVSGSPRIGAAWATRRIKQVSDRLPAATAGHHRKSEGHP